MGWGGCCRRRCCARSGGDPVFRKRKYHARHDGTRGTKRSPFPVSMRFCPWALPRLWGCPCPACIPAPKVGGWSHLMWLTTVPLFQPSPPGRQDMSCIRGGVTASHTTRHATAQTQAGPFSHCRLPAMPPRHRSCWAELGPSPPSLCGRGKLGAATARMVGHDQAGPRGPPSEGAFGGLQGTACSVAILHPREGGTGPTRCTAASPPLAWRVAAPGVPVHAASRPPAGPLPDSASQVPQPGHQCTKGLVPGQVRMSVRSLPS